jgi:tol-pal system protein YbgF
LTACPSPQQEQSLTQIQSQLSVLSNEVRDSFKQSEEEVIDLYGTLNNEVKVLQKNQADAATVNDQLAASLIAIEAKLDEYNARMMKLNERLDTTEATLTERISSLSDQMSEIGSETTITPGVPEQRPAVLPEREVPEIPETLRSPDRESLDSEASRMYHQPYTFYVNGDFESAIAGFQKYLEVYPDSDLADISQFWIAESFFSLGEYETALREYDILISGYPNSDKIPDAFFSKAEVYLQLERQIEAISHLKYVINQFPNTTVAQKASDRLRSLGE